MNWNAAPSSRISASLPPSPWVRRARRLCRRSPPPPADHLLAQDHVANSGHLVSLAPGQGGAAGQWVLVTSEHTTGQGDYAGLPAALHVIYAQLTHSSQGWVVTRWQSQS